MADLMFVLAEGVVHTEAATHGEGAAAHGEAHADPTAFGMDATVYVSIAMLVFLGILLWKKVPAMIAAGLDAKIAAIKSQLDEAEHLRGEAEALKAEYEAKIGRAGDEASEMLARAQNEADALVTKAKADATALIARRKKMAEDRIAAAEAAALAEVRSVAAAAASSAAATLIAAKHDADTDKALVDHVIGSLAKR